ncbi:hypothetical protein ACETK8_13650 [Brevundimonas staleyi]|uniref:Lipoprotein n=1 Tax=Brevundimonas staleyi TaxID=74326 RepID=A0ABW0FNM6_9CAUL
MKRLVVLSAALTALASLGACAKPTISLAEFHARSGRVPMSTSLRNDVLPCAADTSPIADPRFGRSMPYVRGQTC